MTSSSTRGRGCEEKTYRAQGIPPEYTIETTTDLLERILSLADAAGKFRVIIDSFAPSPYKDLNQTYTVATFSVEGNTPKLSSNGNQWRFPLPRNTKPGARPSRRETIIIDTHFHNFTPLNSHDQQASEYEVELVF
jgi:hypothetical protein